MTYQPKTAGDHEREVIDSLLARQDEVLSSLNELSEQIELVVEDLKAQRQSELAAEQEIDSADAERGDSRILPINRPQDDVQIERAA